MGTKVGAKYLLRTQSIIGRQARRAMDYFATIRYYYCGCGSGVADGCGRRIYEHGEHRTSGADVVHTYYFSQNVYV